MDGQMSAANISSVKYDYVTKTLTVYYRGGVVNAYAPVSVEAFTNCLGAKDLSRVIYEIVRTGSLVGKKVEKV
jgi:hypothetical protein